MSQVEKIAELRKAFAGHAKELAKSPCIYRKCDLWSDCRKCNGFMKGCEARLPEILLRDKS